MRVLAGGAYGLGCLGVALLVGACGGSTQSEAPATGDGGSHVDATASAHDAGNGGSIKGDSSSSHKDGPNVTQPAPDSSSGPPEASTPHDALTGHDAPVTRHDATEACPAMAPATGSMCMTPQEQCTYGDTTCDCSFMRTWGCVTCPASKPTEGSACTPTGGGGMGGGGTGGFGGGQTCTYGGSDCACTDDKWACGKCPATAPTDQSACTVDGETCTYDGGGCRCGRAFGMGGMGTTDSGATEEWRCGGGMGMGMMPTCPTAQPDAGTACTMGEDCRYRSDGGARVTCACVAGGFACN